MEGISLRLPPQDAFERVRPKGKSSSARQASALTLAAMSLGFAVVQLDVTIVNTALSVIGASLGGGVSELQWVVNAYTIAFAAFILTAGALGDRRLARLRVVSECGDLDRGASRPGAWHSSAGARYSWLTFRSDLPGCG